MKYRNWTIIDEEIGDPSSALISQSGKMGEEYIELGAAAAKHGLYSGPVVDEVLDVINTGMRFLYLVEQAGFDVEGAIEANVRKLKSRGLIK